jgi:hypothetical protein
MATVYMYGFEGVASGKVLTLDGGIKKPKFALTD